MCMCVRVYAQVGLTIRSRPTERANSKDNEEANLCCAKLWEQQHGNGKVEEDKTVGSKKKKKKSRGNN